MKVKESQVRSIIKALSYRAMGASLTMAIAYSLTGKLGFAATFGLLDVVVKIAGYYVHERLWERVQFGRTRMPDYEI